MKLKKILLILGVSAISGLTVNSTINSFVTFTKQQNTNNVGDQNNAMFTQVSNGLPITESITATAQDNLGHILVGTKTGLYRSIDMGKTYTSFQSATFGTLQITKILVDTNAYIWIGTNLGIYKSNNDGKSFVPHTNGLPDAGLVKIKEIVQMNGAIYIGTNKGLYWIGYYASWFIPTAFNPGFDILAFSVNSANRVLVTTRTAEKDNLWVSDNYLNNVTDANFIFKSPVNFMFKNSNNPNAVWTASIGDNKINNLVSIKTSTTLTSSTLSVETGSVKIISLFVNSNNEIYVGTDHGLYVGKGGANGVIGTVSATSRFNTAYSVNSIYQNVTGSMFVGTNANGLWTSFNKIYGVDILNGGHSITLPRKDGGTSIYYNQNVDIYSKNDSIKKISVNGVNIVKSGNWSKTLTDQENKGAFQIVFYDSNGATTTVNIFIKKTITSDDITFNSPNNNIFPFKATYNWGNQNIYFLFVRINDPKGNTAINAVFNNTMDKANSYYQAFNGYNPDGSLKVFKAKGSFNTSPSGIGNKYVLTLTDKLGNSVKCFLQIANNFDKPIMNNAASTPSGGDNILPPLPTPKPNPIKQSDLWIYIGSAIGAIVFLSVLAVTAIYFRKKIKL